MAGLELVGLCAGVLAVCAVVGVFALALASLGRARPGHGRVLLAAALISLACQIDAIALARALWSGPGERLRVAEQAVAAFEQFGPVMFDSDVRAYADYADFADPIEKLVALRDGLRAPDAPIGWGALGARRAAAGGGALVLLSALAGCLLTALGAAAIARFMMRAAPGDPAPR